MSFIPEKPQEIWYAIGGTAIYLLIREGGYRSLAHRLAQIVASILLTISLYEVVASYTNLPEVPVVIAIMTFGILILDAITTLLNDKAMFKEILLSRLKGKNK